MQMFSLTFVWIISLCTNTSTLDLHIDLSLSLQGHFMTMHHGHVYHVFTIREDISYICVCSMDVCIPRLLMFVAF
mgnify:CR=1 FL=1